MEAKHLIDNVLAGGNPKALIEGFTRPNADQQIANRNTRRDQDRQTRFKPEYEKFKSILKQFNLNPRKGGQGDYFNTTSALVDQHGDYFEVMVEDHVTDDLIKKVLLPLKHHFKSVDFDQGYRKFIVHF